MNQDPVNVYRTRVRTHQTDLNAAMYHGAYFDIFDDARIETFRRLGCTYGTMMSEGWATVIRRVECDFRAPAFMDEEITITVRVAKITRVTLVLQYACRRGDDLLALAHVTFAFLDQSGKPIRVPASVREPVEAQPEVMLVS